MNLVACPRCGSQFDVSSFAPGSSFKCGACENVLQVPSGGAPAVPVVPPAAPAATPAAKAAPRAAAAASPIRTRKAGVDPRRAGGSAGEDAKSGRAERLRQQRAEGGGKKKNPLPLVAALGGALVLAVLGVMQFAGKGGDAGAGEGDGTSTALGPKEGGGDGSSSATGPGKGSGREAAANDWGSMSDAQKLAVIETKIKDAARSPDRAREAYEFLESRGLKEDAARALAAAHDAFPRDAWVNDKLGLVDRGADVKAIANDEMVLFNVANTNTDLQFVLELQRKIQKDPAAAYLSELDSRTLTAAIKNLHEIVKKMEDPVYQRTRREYDNVRLNPSFTGMEFSFESFRPYVIFVEHPGADRKDEADRIVRITGETLQNLYETWLRVMRDDLGLQPKTMEELDDDRLKVFVFKSRESFDAWHARNKRPNPGASTAAYYEHGRDRMIIMHLDAFDPGVIRHEGTHQLIHYYARHFTQAEDDAIAEKRGEPKEEVRFEDGRLSCAFFWFQEGIAEYFRGSEIVDGKLVLGKLLEDRLRFFNYEEKQKKLWPLPDFLFADQQQINAQAGVRGGGLGQDELKGLMYCQGWVLVHYFMEGDGGKWRPQFLKVVRSELTGTTGKPSLLRAFGLPPRSEDPKVQAWMNEVEKGYLDHFHDLFKKLSK